MNKTMSRYNTRTREAMNRARCYIIISMMLLFLLLFSVFFFSKTVTAQKNSDRIKVAASVQVKTGDTLWSIASNYISDEYEDMNDYIKELKDSNGLTSDTIHAGNYIIVPYYTSSR